jgi:soluble lytic murein transglycosylase-like protein
VPVRIARVIRAEAIDKGVPMALAFGVVEQESGFQHIFGHDTDFYAGRYVTRLRYRKLVRHVRNGGTSNGVGLMQITYPGYLLEEPTLWRRRDNVGFGFKILKDLRRSYGSWEKALAVYNGGPSNPQYGYASEVLARRTRWRAIFKR